jgi:REP element-mobilizing transposase RayT
MTVPQRRFAKPMRHPGHDYRAPCSVHVTICAWDRQWLFGAMSPSGVRLNDAGRFVEAALLGMHAPADGIEIDTHIVMPDHLHAIIHLGTQPLVEPAASIPDLIGSFKLRVVRSWPGGVRTRAWPRYEDHLWQKTYYDTLIRSDRHLDATRVYILDNPRRWLERGRS